MPVVTDVFSPHKHPWVATPCKDRERDPGDVEWKRQAESALVGLNMETMRTQTTVGTCTGSITDLECMWRGRDNDPDIWESPFSAITRETGRLIRTYTGRGIQWIISSRLYHFPVWPVDAPCKSDRISNPGSALNKHGDSDGPLHSQTLIYILICGESWYQPYIIVGQIKYLKYFSHKWLKIHSLSSHQRFDSLGD